MSLIETKKQCTYMWIWNMTQTIDYEYLSALCFIEICESWIEDVWIRKMRRVWMTERKMYVLIFIGVVYYLNKQKYWKTQILHLLMYRNQTLVWKLRFNECNDSNRNMIFYIFCEILFSTILLTNWIIPRYDEKHGLCIR